MPCTRNESCPVVSTIKSSEYAIALHVLHINTLSVWMSCSLLSLILILILNVIPYHTMPCRTTYAKVAGKYQDVLTLESSVAELHQMFLDFALLTEQQGELLDQIEFQVKQAGDYVEEANVDVHEAIQFQKAIRKKQCWIMLIAVVAIVVVLFAAGVLP